MTAPAGKPPFRIASREDADGEWIRAYVAPPDSMEGAVEVARFHKNLKYPEGTRAAWIKFLEALGNATALEALGLEPLGFTVEEPPERKA